MPRSKLIIGKNDLATVFPKIALEADSWDPSTVLPGSDKKVNWKCKKGHTWVTRVSIRTRSTHGCPYCMNRKVWSGFNDLKTLFPEIAKEADGWDPSEVVYGSSKKLSWKCKEGHTWLSTIVDRTGTRKSGCPYCANRNAKVWTGFNDLKTLFPDIAKEAYGWNPSKVLATSCKKYGWQCEKGHSWKASVISRKEGSNCPFCANRNAKVWSGFNDLKTLFPHLVEEADGWNPSNVLPGSEKMMPWKCKEGHTWKASPANRSKGRGCPYCAPFGAKVWSGFNDLKTLYPQVAEEADDWDPSKYIAKSKEKMPWKCSKGHKWISSISNRTSGHGCPNCADYGFKPGELAWLYLMNRPGEQQFGITNNLERRTQAHQVFGWTRVDAIGPHEGIEIFNLEKELKSWLSQNIGVIPGTTENWYTRDLRVLNLSELLEKSGIYSSLLLK
tara:strand:+ start:190 stop:1518 length:1329 start_codon:yes stop_codon:yes gene_type:complete